MKASLGIYRVSGPDSSSPVRQGEILTNVNQICVNPETLSPGQELEIFVVNHPFALVLTQDCDLVQDYKVRNTSPEKSDKMLHSILFAGVATAEEMFGSIQSSKLWKTIKQNKNERYHFLEKVVIGCDFYHKGLPELAIDFKQYFTIPTAELYQRIANQEAQRRCVLNSPYMEHVSSRFAYFMKRVALPEDHFSEP